MPPRKMTESKARASAPYIHQPIGFALSVFVEIRDEAGDGRKDEDDEKAAHEGFEHGSPFV